MTSIVLFLVPLGMLLLVFAAIDWLKSDSRGHAAKGSEAELARLNFHVLKYVLFLLALPVCVLLSTVVIAFSMDFTMVLRTILWTLLGLALALAWGSYRLVCLVSERTRLQEAFVTGTRA